MTPRERWEAVLNRRSPDRVPMFWSATDETAAQVLKHTGESSLPDLFARLRIDSIHEVTPRYAGPPISDNHNVFGCRYEVVQYGTGQYHEVVECPLAGFDSIDEIEANYRWPDPDWWDYSEIADGVRNAGHLPVQGNSISPFMWFGYLRGLEQSFIDLVEHPDIAHYVLDKLVEHEMTMLQRVLNESDGAVLYAFVADDFGSQQSLMISLELIREFYIPKVKPVIDLLHQVGAKVIHHNDGAIRPMLPDMIDAGIDVLNPIQWRCNGMDREGLKRDFGDKLVFHGAVDNQQTLAFGSAEDVRQEVIDNLRILGEGGGYILGPCHNMQAVSPVENVLALYETGYEEGWC